MEKSQYRVKGLPTGEKMQFRVVAVNIAGRSPPAYLGQPVMIREIMGGCTAGRGSGVGVWDSRGQGSSD